MFCEVLKQNVKYWTQILFKKKKKKKKSKNVGIKLLIQIG